MPTRFKRRRVYISYSGQDEPVEAIILDSFKDAGEFWYRIKIIDSGYIIDVTARSVDYIAHRRSRVIPIQKLKLVK